MPRDLARILAGCAAIATCLLTASCGSSDDTSSDKPSDSSSSASASASPSESSSPSESASPADADSQTVSSDGYSFAVPKDFSEIDAADVKGDDATYDDLAGRLGVTSEQFDQAIKSVDLFLFSDDGPQDGFLDNINVIEQQGALPGDDELTSQFGQLGATVNDITHTDTDAGEVADIDYDLAVSGTTVAGRGILVSTDDGSVVTITVSAGDRDTAGEIGDLIVSTLATAS